ncbi:hypothetical protein AEAC466_19230 [Asticcacaulis sp. AC466]|uniref:hypothetical protein n=1 Tax=Asticcacaulis sp. AC466 TaxID=1282362 RepID=UPI0003C3E819|nr:hypothetical protein [Asticcacaulis sp. AC466]ESQ82053.1 hypothetical protein AEAC466_19230 [Asticcacaulis sp. AC466]
MTYRPALPTPNRTYGEPYANTRGYNDPYGRDLGPYPRAEVQGGVDPDFDDAALPIIVRGLRGRRPMRGAL